MKTTMFFPGQGSQKAGMGANVVETFSTARRRFEEANDILGRDIGSLCFNGPDDELKQTQNTQPALFTVEAALYDVLKEKGVEPLFTAGHSLGEYGALYAAGVFDFETGLKLVARRGELMASAGEKRPGTMAAIIGMSIDKINEVCAGISAGVVVAANQNTPVQTVISGEVDAVKAACTALKEAGAKRALPLPVSGAFHSPLMQEVADEFSAFLADARFSAPSCPVVTNVTAQGETDENRLKELLVKQLVSPVRWVETVAWLEKKGCDGGVEVGPGSVIAGLVTKCSANIKVVPCATAENVYSLVS